MPNELTRPSDDAAIPEELADYLRAENIVAAINANLPAGLNSLPPIPKDYVFKKRDKDVIAIVLHSAFQLRGGLPAFLAWADQNPKEFYAMWQKLYNDPDLNSGAGVSINFNSPIPENALDRVSVNEEGNVIDLDLPE